MEGAGDGAETEVIGKRTARRDAETRRRAMFNRKLSRRVEILEGWISRLQIKVSDLRRDAVPQRHSDERCKECGNCGWSVAYPHPEHTYVAAPHECRFHPPTEMAWPIVAAIDKPCHQWKTRQPTETEIP